LRLEKAPYFDQTVSLLQPMPPESTCATFSERSHPLLRCADIPHVFPMLRRFGLACRLMPPNAAIPGSYWGAPEAGLVGGIMYFRDDTPLHSALHESCHFICMDEQRRARLHTDAGGDYAEEDAVCYLQITLAERLPGVGRHRLCADMDAWGYSFRLGSAQAWYEHDAEDARAWLIKQGILRWDGVPTWTLRE